MLDTSKYSTNNAGSSIAVFVILIQSLIFIFFFPNLESPDTLYHIGKVLGNTSYDGEFYFVILNKFKDLIEYVIGKQLKLDYTLTGVREYFSMKNIVEYPSGNNKTIIIFQLFNISLVLLSILLFNYIVKKDSKTKPDEKDIIKKINYLYFLYPQTAYFITSISPDFFNYLIQPLFLYLLYTKRYKTDFILMLLMYNFFDNGIITNIFFMAIYLVFHYILKIYKTKNRSNWALFTTLTLITIYYISRNFLQSFIKINPLIDMAAQAIEQHGVLSTKVINFFLSSFCFWGIGNYITFPLIYLLYFFALAYFVVNAIKKDDVINKYYFEVLLSLFSTIMIILIFYGTHSNIRFFMFWIPIVLIGYFINISKNKYLRKINYDALVLLFFFHNVFLIFFYSIKIFILF